jgi:multidrug efflux pump subunit AcrA (membrane-fusion protein)
VACSDMIRRRRHIIATAAAAAWILGASPGKPSRAFAADPAVTAAPQVAVVRAVNACFSSTVRTTGFVVARQEAVVNLDAPGFSVVEVLANEGDRVASAQVLARLARQPTDGPDPAGAQAGSSATLKAPAAGLITKSTAMVGAVASPVPTEPLFRIAAGNEIELEVEVPSIHVLDVKPGQTARVDLENGRELIGRVRLAPAEVDPRTQLGKARISLQVDPPLPIGMFGSAAIDASRSCGVSVPSSAIIYRTGGTRVHVVRDSTIHTVPVRVGLQSDTDTEILDGLREGDVVVANAGGSLRERDKVNAIFADDSQRSER